MLSLESLKENAFVEYLENINHLSPVTKRTETHSYKLCNGIQYVCAIEFVQITKLLV